MGLLNRKRMLSMPRFPGCMVARINRNSGLQGNGNTYYEKLQYPSIAIDAAGNTFVAFDSLIAPGYTDQSSASVKKFNMYGVLEWQRKLGNSTNYQMRTFDQRYDAAATDPAGNLYVVASSSLSGVYFALVYKLSPAGDLLWCRKITYNNVSNGTNQSERIAIDPQGFVYLCGGTSNESFVAKFNNDMTTMLWIAYGPLTGVQNFSMSPNGRYVVFAGFYYPNGSVSNCVVRVDTASGAVKAFGIFAGDSQVNSAFVDNNGQMWAYHFGANNNAGFFRVDPDAANFGQVPLSLYSQNSNIADATFGPDGLFWSVSIWHGLLAMNAQGTPVAAYPLNVNTAGWVPGAIAINPGGTIATVGWDVQNYAFLDVVKVPNDGTGQGVYGGVNYTAQAMAALSAGPSIYQSPTSVPGSSTMVLSNTLMSPSEAFVTAETHATTIYNIITS